MAIGSNLSALWILIANSFMQQPVGYVLRNGRAEMDDFFGARHEPERVGAVPARDHRGLATAGFFVLGISAWHLLRKDADADVFRRSFRFGGVYAFAAHGGRDRRRAQPGASTWSASSR